MELVCPNTLAVEKLTNDMYHGDSRKPGITTRVEIVENAQSGFRNQLRAMDRKVWAIILLLLGVGVEIAVKGKS